MRIISQDGMIDAPYEQVVIQRYEGRIYLLDKNLTGIDGLVNDIEIANYYTEAKAKKAMEMLRKAYQGNKIEETYHEGTNYYHPIFQFPADDEVEI